MKLYATTTSERATKGQGGNKYLVIKIQDEEEQEIACITVNPKLENQSHDIVRIDYPRSTEIVRIPWDYTKQKGKKQEGENQDKRICPHGKSLFYENCESCGYDTKKGLIK